MLGSVKYMEGVKKHWEKLLKIEGTFDSHIKIIMTGLSPPQDFHNSSSNQDRGYCCCYNYGNVVHFSSLLSLGDLQFMPAAATTTTVSSGTFH